MALYEESVGLIREQNPDVILNLTTGLGSGCYPKDPLLPTEAGPDTHLWTAERRVKHVLKLKPEICTLDLETAQVFGGIVVSTVLQRTRMANLVRAVGVPPEIELFDRGDTVLAKHLIEKGVLRGPGINSFVMRLNFTMPAATKCVLVAGCPHSRGVDVQHQFRWRRLVALDELRGQQLVQSPDLRARGAVLWLAEGGMPRTHRRRV